MATTDAKPGFRLPWSSERGEPANPADVAQEEATGESSNPPQENETPEMIDAAPATDSEAAVETSASPAPTPATPEPEQVPPATAASAPAASRKPNKFMADLTKAMQAAAGTAREDTLARFNAEAKTHIENIHAASATEATELRKQADDDVAAIRDWSKAEIARIREETDERITHRKSALEGEIEEHAAYIERRIERVQARVSAFESEMAEFFDRLLAEDDPTRFAAMAESLPEPPPFDGDAPEPRPAAVAAAVVEDVQEPAVEPEAASPTASTHAADTAQVEAPVAEAVAEPTPDHVDASQDAGDLFGMSDDTPAEAPADDPRLSALGITPDFAAAEAEAATFSAPTDGDDDEVPVIADDALAARLADLVPDGEVAPTTTTTRLTVTGLISVASIAGFKRHLSRVPGVQSVGVSSGPDGEFVFAVAHGPELVLRDVIPTLPSYSARVTAESDGELTVAARDPEAEG
jgi:hypothetical protein